MRLDASQHIVPDWPAPSRVRALLTTRRGGVSEGPYQSLNFGHHVGDSPAAVAANRAILQNYTRARAQWLDQVHGIHLQALHRAEGEAAMEADGAFTRQPGLVCAVMTADCLPVLICDEAGTQVAALHAGWRGLVAGILARAVAAFDCSPETLLAYLGPAISARAFEVGGEVRDAFLQAEQRRPYASAVASAFKARANHEGKYWADLYALARSELGGLGLTRVYGGDRCTYTEAEDFFSYRREGRTGRMVSAIWLADAQ